MPYKKLGLIPVIDIVTCYLLTHRIISGLRIFISIYWIHQAEFTITYNLCNYITWTSNLFWFSICPKLVQTTPEDLPCPLVNCYRVLFVMTAMTRLLRNQSLTPFIVSAIHCWSVRCHDICISTDRCLVVTIPHCFGCRGYFVYRTVGSTLVVSADT
jgi:hypothetical protein